MLTNKFRLIVVASLLVALSTTGVTPCVRAGASCDAAPGEPHAPKACGCGAGCCGRCGMACCQAPAPKQDPLPAPPKPSDELSVPLGLAAATAAKIDPTAASEFRHGVVDDGLWTAARPSLLALSIRFNV